MMPYPIRVFSDEYYTSLGRFIAEFSQVEALLQVTLWILVGVRPPVAGAVFSGVRAEEAANKIKRIGDAQKWSETRMAEWKVISDRLGILRTLRNDILHYGAEWLSEDTWLVTNRRVAHTEKVTETIVTVASLNEATKDLVKLEMHVFDFLFGDQMCAESRETMSEAILKPAWLYKSSQPAGRRDKSRNTTPAPPIPPPASEG
jgi:hypothetical protein